MGLPTASLFFHRFPLPPKLLFHNQIPTPSNTKSPQSKLKKQDALPPKTTTTTTKISLSPLHPHTYNLSLSLSMCLISLCICDWTLCLYTFRAWYSNDQAPQQTNQPHKQRDKSSPKTLCNVDSLSQPSDVGDQIVLFTGTEGSYGRMQRPQQSHAHADLLLLLPLLSCKHRKAAFSGMAVTQPQPPLTTARLWNVLLGEAYWTWTFRASEYGLESIGDNYSGGAEFAEGPRESICSANSEWEV